LESYFCIVIDESFAGVKSKQTTKVLH